MKTPAGHHTFNPFRNCQRWFYWAEIRGLEPRQVGPSINDGRMIHAVLSHYHGGLPMEQALTTTRAEQWIEGRGALNPEAFEDAWANVSRIMGVYTRWQSEEALTFEATEVVGSATLHLTPGLGEPYTWRTDALVRDPRGWLWIMDYKSTTRGFADLFRRFEMERQMTGEVWGEKAQGRDVKGFIIRAIRRLKSLNPADLFRDQKFLRSPMDLAVWLRDHQRLVRTIRAHPKPMDTWPQNFDVCFSDRGHCPFWALCRHPRTAPQAIEAYFTQREPA